jgi:superfamily II DNA/RNA helicase
MTFDDLGLSDAVRGAVQQAGYTTPTPIQAQAIPHILERRDVLGIAQTGTGKTAAFTLPMLTMLETGRARARMPRTLILEPTRELAAQVEESFSKYGVNHKLSVALLIGGVSFGDQDVKITRGADVLIATPGRLLDHVERGKLLLTGVELLVIDEADRMLDMGFIPDIERICKLVPFTRQTLFFTATMPPEIQRLTGQFLHNPIRVEVAPPATTAATIQQTLVATGAQAFEKRQTLRTLLAAPDLKNAIIFCNRKRSVVELHRSLLRHDFSTAALHGDMDQPSRMRALEGFRQGETKFLVASDVAARGLDIPAVSHIFNFDTPHHAEDYVHRIGRTGRAGLPGTAITLVTPDDTKLVAAIEKLIGQSIAWASVSPSPVTTNGPNHQVRSRGSRPERGRARGGRRAAPALASASQGTKPADPARDRKVANGGPRTASKSAAAPQRSAPPEREPAVLGLGDHVPSFLKRPTTRR